MVSASVLLLILLPGSYRSFCAIAVSPCSFVRSMAGDKILVLGATGPAGICLLRELLHRQHATIAYVRSPAKIPQDLASNPLLEVIKGEMDDEASLSAAIAQSSTILSYLGPNTMRPPAPFPYPGHYAKIFPLMREHGVKRIMAMSTVSAAEASDTFNLVIYLMILFISTLAPAAYRTMLGIAKVFQEEAHDLDWTVFRVAMIPGGDDEASWRKDREDTTFAGYVGDKDYKYWARRGALARWLVDCAEGGQEQWVHKLPAVSNLSDGKAKSA
ncbi:hypothetical protein BJ170DRAFT_637243 [Xylariales sp. AK1849]|nr:hypothetical protein BJ170DRAFT_637243 [Xylariales sp. AK1849]